MYLRDIFLLYCLLLALFGATAVLWQALAPPASPEEQTRHLYTTLAQQCRQGAHTELPSAIRGKLSPMNP